MSSLALRVRARHDRTRPQRFVMSARQDATFHRPYLVCDKRILAMKYSEQTNEWDLRRLVAVSALWGAGPASIAQVRKIWSEHSATRGKIWMDLGKKTSDKDIWAVLDGRYEPSEKFADHRHPDCVRDLFATSAYFGDEELSVAQVAGAWDEHSEDRAAGWMGLSQNPKDNWDIVRDKIAA